MKHLIQTAHSNYMITPTYNPNVSILEGGNFSQPLYIKTPNFDGLMKGDRFPFICENCGANGEYSGAMYNTSPIEQLYDVPQNVLEDVNIKGYNVGKIELATNNHFYTITPTNDKDTCLLTGGQFFNIPIDTPFFNNMQSLEGFQFCIKNVPENGDLAGKFVKTSAIVNSAIIDRNGKDITSNFTQELGIDKMMEKMQEAMQMNDDFARA